MSNQVPDQYLAILKASYDYTPQSDDEISIKQDQQLLLVEKVDEDWWKVKVTGNEEESENQIGLVPAAYVEQAPHTSVVKALYDYEAAAPGEITVHENDILLVFETEEDWLLVQDSRSEGRAGYVPGNYVEVVEEDEVKEATSTSIIVPDSPPKPAYVDPADMVASTKVTADDIKTWSVSEVDKKGKKKKGTLGIGNGSLFFASESDKTPVQKWGIKDVAAVSSEKAKHVSIDIGGSSPTHLHFHTSSRENANAILEKLATSGALSTPPDRSERLTVNTAPSSPTKKASVHFSPAAPTIIPDPEEQEPQLKDDKGEMVLALYDFNADGEDELTVKEGEKLTVLEKDGEEWWKCKNIEGVEGVVPASYLEVIEQNETTNSNKDTEVEARRAEETRRAREREEEKRQMEAAAALKAEVRRKVKETTSPAQPERVKPRTAAPPVTSHQEPLQSPVHGLSSDVSRPPPGNTRTWHDRSGQFRVEAAFLGFNNGKLRLHKVNGVIVEVPSEKMSLDDMQYVEKLMDKKSKTPVINHSVSDDDIPLALAKNVKTSPKDTSSSKKGPQIDWFDFFLSAGCEVDDCTRYSAAFEKDKIDETLLNDITDGTMRSLGLREGDIIRVTKAIEKRKPADNLEKPSAHLQEQVLRDEEFARQLQAQENAAANRTPAPNLFVAGPGGILKPRRGRPQPSKSLPPTNVDLTAISSGQIKRDDSPRIGTSSPHPPRPGSATATTTSGFEDDAWTNRPSSTKPAKSNSPVSSAISPASSVPPALTPTPTLPPKPEPSQTAQRSSQDDKGPSNLAKTTEVDILNQLARLSDLRKNSTPPASQPTVPKSAIIQPPGYQSGMGMGSSPLSLAHLANSTVVSPPPTQISNGPRGPYAPVPANQGLLQPLIPTQTGFGGFVPTKPTQASPFQNQVSSPSFIPPQTTGFHSPSAIMTHPTGVFENFRGASSSPPFIPPQTTGFHPPSAVMTHPTGAFGNLRGASSSPSFILPQTTSFHPPSAVMTHPTGAFRGPSFQGTDNFVSMAGLASAQPTGLNSHMNLSPFSNSGGYNSSPPPLNTARDTAPASVFAQMKSGTFANEDTPNGLNGQTTSWGHQPYQAYMGH